MQHLRPSRCGGIDGGHGCGNGHAPDIDRAARAVNRWTMFDEADLPKKKSDLLADLAREDLDRLSIADLDERIAGLEAELRV